MRRLNGHANTQCEGCRRNGFFEARDNGARIATLDTNVQIAGRFVVLRDYPGFRMKAAF
jgi:hypothetical protein